MDQKTRRMLMAVAGAYLVYVGGTLAYNVIQTRPDKFIIFILIGIIFVIVGALTAVANFKEFLNETKKEFEVTDDTDESDDIRQKEE